MDDAMTTMRRRIRTFAIVWTILCAALGVVVTQQLLVMRHGAEAMDDVGIALHTTAESLDELADLPVVGGAIGGAADVVEASSSSVRESASDVDRSLILLAVFTGLAITLLPTVPVLLLWWLFAGPTPSRE